MSLLFYYFFLIIKFPKKNLENKKIPLLHDALIKSQRKTISHFRNLEMLKINN